MEPNKINVYARQTTRTMKDHVTEQGFGYSSPLETPETSIIYIWEGKLHGTPSNVIRTSSIRESIDSLARDLALALRSHQSPQHNKAGLPSYRIYYDVKETSESWHGSKTVTKPLTAYEQDLFSKALETARRKKGN